MPLVRILTVGKLKEKYWVEAQAEYLKRLRPYLKLELKEVADFPCPDNAGPALEEQVRRQECAALENLIIPKSFLVTLDLRGKQLTSPELAEFFNERLMYGEDVTMVIGGSLGLTEELVKRANLNLSFSKMTFPHQLFRVMLLEQIYRACRIMRGEPYHK